MHSGVFFQNYTYFHSGCLSYVHKAMTILAKYVYSISTLQRDGSYLNLSFKFTSLSYTNVSSSMLQQ